MASRIIIAPYSTQGMDANYRTAQLGLEKVAMDSANKIHDFSSIIFQEKTKVQKKGTSIVMSGMTGVSDWNGSSAIPNMTMSYLYDAVWEQFLFAAGFEVTYEDDLWDDTYDVNANFASEAAKAIAHFQQQLYMNALNDAFLYNFEINSSTTSKTSTWFDGVTFFSAAHPWAPNSGLSGYQSNLMTGPLDIVNWMAAMIMGASMKDPMGRPLNQRPVKLLVHDTKVSDAHAILNLGMGVKQGTLSDRNPFKDFGIADKDDFIVGSPWVSPVTAWYLQFDTPKTYLSSLRKLTMFKPIETLSHGVKRDMAFTCGAWAESYTGWIGSTGA